MACCPNGIFRPIIIDCGGSTKTIPIDGHLRLADMLYGFEIREVLSTSTYTSDTFYRNTFAIIDASAAAFTFYLPPDFYKGRQFIIKKSAGGANNITVDGNGKNIDGSATQTISTQFDSLHIVSGSSDWWIASSK